MKTEVVHSQSNPAWNVVNTTIGEKYKICRVPYVVTSNVQVNEKNKQEALMHAEFISTCFNISTIKQ